MCYFVFVVIWYFHERKYNVYAQSFWQQRAAEIHLYNISIAANILAMENYYFLIGGLVILIIVLKTISIFGQEVDIQELTEKLRDSYNDSNKVQLFLQVAILQCL